MARDGVPANSAAEALMNDHGHVTVVGKTESNGEAPSEASAVPNAAQPEPEDAPSPPPKEPPKAGKSSDARKADSAQNTQKVTQKECDGLFDRYIELTIATDPRFADVPPEMLADLKNQGLMQAAQKAANPCAKAPVSRAQYNCANSAKTTDAWERCLK